MIGGGKIEHCCHHTTAVVSNVLKSGGSDFKMEDYPPMSISETQPHSSANVESKGMVAADSEEDSKQKQKCVYMDLVNKEETCDIYLDGVQESKTLPSERDLQELRFDNLKSLLAKSSRYAELLLVKVKKEEEKQSRRSRKRKSLDTVGSDSKKKRSNASNCQMLSRAELETLAAGDGSKQDEKEDEHLQEFDEPKSFTGSFISLIFLFVYKTIQEQIKVNAAHQSGAKFDRFWLGKGISQTILVFLCPKNDVKIRLSQDFSKDVIPGD